MTTYSLSRDLKNRTELVEVVDLIFEFERDLESVLSSDSSSSLLASSSYSSSSSSSSAY